MKKKVGLVLLFLVILFSVNLVTHDKPQNFDNWEPAGKVTWEEQWTMFKDDFLKRVGIVQFSKINPRAQLFSRCRYLFDATSKNTSDFRRLLAEQSDGYFQNSSSKKILIQKEWSVENPEFPDHIIHAIKVKDGVILIGKSSRLESDNRIKRLELAKIDTNGNLVARSILCEEEHSDISEIKSMGISSIYPCTNELSEYTVFGSTSDGQVTKTIFDEELNWTSQKMIDVPKKGSDQATSQDRKTDSLFLLPTFTNEEETPADELIYYEVSEQGRIVAEQRIASINNQLSRISKDKKKTTTYQTIKKDSLTTDSARNRIMIQEFGEGIKEADDPAPINLLMVYPPDSTSPVYTFPPTDKEKDFRSSKLTYQADLSTESRYYFTVETEKKETALYVYDTNQKKAVKQAVFPRLSKVKLSRASDHSYAFCSYRQDSAEADGEIQGTVVGLTNDLFDVVSMSSLGELEETELVDIIPLDQKHFFIYGHPSTSENTTITGVLEVVEDEAPLIKIPPISIHIDDPQLYLKEDGAVVLEQQLLSGIEVYDTHDSQADHLGQEWLEKRMNRNPQKLGDPIDWRSLGYDINHTLYGTSAVGPKEVEYFVTDSLGQETRETRIVSNLNNQTVEGENYAVHAENFDISFERMKEKTLDKELFLNRANAFAWDKRTGEQSEDKWGRSNVQLEVDETQLKNIREAKIAKPYPVDVILKKENETIKNRVWVFVTDKNTRPNDQTNVVFPYQTNGFVFYGNDLQIPLSDDESRHSLKELLTQGKVRIYDYYDCAHEDANELPAVADWNNPSDFVLNDARFNQIDYVYKGETTRYHIEGEKTVGYIEVVED